MKSVVTPSDGKTSMSQTGRYHIIFVKTRIKLLKHFDNVTKYTFFKD